MALVPLIGAGLLIRSFIRLQEVNPGFDPARVLSVEVYLPRATYNGPQAIAFFKELLGRVQNLPGDLSEAIRAFEKDKFLQTALGSHISDHIIEAKRAEWQEYIGQVHPWELDRYLAYY